MGGFICHPGGRGKTGVAETCARSSIMARSLRRRTSPRCADTTEMGSMDALRTRQRRDAYGSAIKNFAPTGAQSEIKKKRFCFCREAENGLRRPFAFAARGRHSASKQPPCPHPCSWFTRVALCRFWARPHESLSSLPLSAAALGQGIDRKTLKEGSGQEVRCDRLSSAALSLCAASGSYPLGSHG